MRVADDGRGLNGEAEAGMGLAGMRDRVRLMGGSVSMGRRKKAELWSKRASQLSDKSRFRKTSRRTRELSPGKHLIIEITCGALRG